MYLNSLQIATRGRNCYNATTTLLHIFLLVAEFFVVSRCEPLSDSLAIRTSKTLSVAILTNIIDREEVRADVAICHEAVKVYDAVLLGLSALQFK